MRMADNSPGMLVPVSVSSLSDQCPTHTQKSSTAAHRHASGSDQEEESLKMTQLIFGSMKNHLGARCLKLRSPGWADQGCELTMES